MKRKILIIMFLFSSHLFLSAQVWHVSGSGDDSGDGKSPKTAFRTLQKAAGLVKPGDQVLIGNGVYTDSGTGNGSAVLLVEASGRPDAWITWKAYPGTRPEIRPRGWSGILVTGSYHVFEGLSVIGANDSLTLLDALADAKKERATPVYNTNGIFVEGRRKKPEEKPHHVIIRNCVIGKCGGGGIALIETDYITVEDCKVFNNAWYMRYAGSGITTLNNWAFDDAPGYHIIIQRNFVWNNKSLVPWERTGKLSDGNGILLDVTDLARGGATNPNADSVVKPALTQTAAAATVNARPKRPEWKGRALIANNVSTYNGGSGIHVFRTKYVDIINNTTYFNGSVVGYQELFPNASEDVVILNNIIVPRPGGKVTSNNRNTNIKWDYNLYPTDQKVFKGANDIVADPMFLKIESDPTKGDFRLAKGSPAINSGSSELTQLKDIKANARPKGSGGDRGAFEQ